MDNSVLIIFAMIATLAAIIQMVILPVVNVTKEIKFYIIIIWGIIFILGVSTIYLVLENDDLKKTMNKHGLYEVMVPVEKVVQNEMRWEFRDKNSVSEAVK